MKRPLIVFGTRPEYIKLKPVMDGLDKLNVKFDICQVGQHDYSIIQSGIYPSFRVENKSSNRLNNIIASVITKLDLNPSETSLVVVQGDTATAYAAAVAAFNEGIPVAHVEAGLRTWDLENPFPEEGYRRMISQIAKYNFFPRLCDAHNWVPGAGHIVGNTVIDTLPDYPIAEHKNKKKIICTIHRRENLPKINEWVESISALACIEPTFEWIFIKHPNHEALAYPGINYINPIKHDDLIKDLAQNVRFLITDSGGLQEEASRYNVPVIVARKVTERPYPGAIICPNPNQLHSLAKEFLMDSFKPLDTRDAFGDGKSGIRIASLIKQIIENELR